MQLQDVITEKCVEPLRSTATRVVPESNFIRSGKVVFTCSPKKWKDAGLFEGSGLKEKGKDAEFLGGHALRNGKMLFFRGVMN